MKLAAILVTWFGAGRAPYASGTAGSLAALPLAFLVHSLWGSFALFAVGIAIFWIGCWACEVYMKTSGCEHDPKEIVIDEVAGQCLMLAALYPTWQSYLTGFILFRVFDIVKPWPVCWADRRMKGGIGVMFDDLLAAFFPMLIYVFLMLEGQALGAQHLLAPMFDFLGGGDVR